MSLPYFKFRPADELGNYQIMTLSLEAMGVWYLFRICQLWQHQGRIPDDSQYIAPMVKITVDQWQEYRQSFLDRGLIQIIDGCITIAAFRDQWVGATEYTDLQRSNQLETQRLKREARILGKNKRKRAVKPPTS